MNVFTDFHHTALLRSLILLFEKRLGGKVYRPIGLEWAESGYWHVYDHPATQQQFLTLAQGYRPEDGTPPLNQFVKAADMVEEDVYYCADPENESFNRAVTLQKFKSMKFDILIASIPAHVEPFKELIRLYQPQAKLILQVGNNWLWQDMAVENVMASTMPVGYGSDKNVIFYHQEFDLELFTPIHYQPAKKISSFVNLLPQYGNEDFLALEAELSEYEFRSYGAGCRNGFKNGVKEVAEGMQDAEWIFHVKRGGDGFGHVIHNAFACGKPVITRISDYKNCLAGQLMIHGETCLDLDLMPPAVAATFIRQGREGSSRTYDMGRAGYKLFKQMCNYDQEEQEVRAFLGRLK